MRRPIVVNSLAALGLWFAGCQASPESPSVTFESAGAIGRWDYVAGASGESSPGTSAGASEGSAGAAGSAGSAGRAGAAGSGSPTGASGSQGGVVATGGTNGAAGTGSAGTAAAGSSGGTAGGGAAGAPSSSLASLSFDVTTSPVGYRYQPKNVGAVWVQDSSGKLVKSLEVWASVRRRYLTRYTSALAGSKVDVVASATLSNHRTHHVTWNMTDRNGAKVAPGSYTLVMELTDGDQTGRSSTISFDTTVGAQVLNPTNAPSFNSMTLQLQ